MELYYFAPSPPCRSVLLFMHSLSLDPVLKEVDISKGDNLKPEFVKVALFLRKSLQNKPYVNLACHS